MSTVKTPLRYPGGKSKAIKKIIKYLPDDFSEYREPFVGGGSLFIYLKQEYPHLKIWINDLNCELFLFWKIAQSHLEELVEEVRKIKHQCTDGRLLFKQLAETNAEELSELQRAVRFFVLNRITFSGTVESGGFSQEAFHKRFTESSIARLARIGEVLENVKITNLDYSEVLKPERSRGIETSTSLSLQPEGNDVFIYLDPPYLGATKSKLYGKRGQLHASFEHQRFAETLKNCPHHWLVTYDDSPEIRERFQFANLFGWELQYGMNNYKQNTAAKGKELMIANYSIPQADEVQLQLKFINY